MEVILSKNCKLIPLSIAVDNAQPESYSVLTVKCCNSMLFAMYSFTKKFNAKPETLTPRLPIFSSTSSIDLALMMKDFGICAEILRCLIKNSRTKSIDYEMIIRMLQEYHILILSDIQYWIQLCPLIDTIVMDLINHRRIELNPFHEELSRIALESLSFGMGNGGTKLANSAILSAINVSLELSPGLTTKVNTIILEDFELATKSFLDSVSRTNTSIPPVDASYLIDLFKSMLF